MTYEPIELRLPPNYGRLPNSRLALTYHVGTFNSVNVPPGFPQSYQEVDSVSQIVATGTPNPPARFTYGYMTVNTGEGTEQVNFLHTITVPSPTGTGNATATIDYAPNTCY